jgi:hypothetical protein
MKGRTSTNEESDEKSVLRGSVGGMASAAQVEGVLMDKMRSASDSGRAAGRPRQYAGVRSHLTFDDAGYAKALAALKTSTKKSDMLVAVSGKISGDTIKVSSLKLQ